MCLLIAVLLTGTLAFAQDKHTVTKASVSYEIKNMGIKTNGKFNNLQADIMFNKANLATSTIEASIEVNSIDSDNEMRDKHLKAEDYFDAARYPKIIMKSVSFKPKGGNNFIGIFNLTIKGKTKLIEVPFTYNESAGTALFKGSFKINRNDFNIGGKSMVLADDATVNMVVETAK